MGMAAGFAMLEAGLVRTKNITEILTGDIALYAIACVIYRLFGYPIMYGGSDSGLIPGLGLLLGDDNSVDAVLQGGDMRLTTRSAPTSSSRWRSSPPPCPSSRAPLPNV
jgi:Amt family ammonium transporter